MIVATSGHFCSRSAKQRPESSHCICVSACDCEWLDVFGNRLLTRPWLQQKCTPKCRNFSGDGTHVAGHISVMYITRAGNIPLLRRFGVTRMGESVLCGDGRLIRRSWFLSGDLPRANTRAAVTYSARFRPRAAVTAAYMRQCPSV